MAQLTTELNLLLDDIARHNLQKLADRAKRNKIHGNGNNR